MNTRNNKRRRESRDRIERVFVELLQTRELDRITVTDICKRAELNRTTFYANYADVYELADSVRQTLEEQTALQKDGSGESHDYLQLFRHIRENQLFYKTYFKLGYDDQYKIIGYDTLRAKEEFDNRFIEYHCEFFRSGLTTIIKLWLNGGCRETPEEMYEIVTSEYSGRARGQSAAREAQSQRPESARRADVAAGSEH